MSLDWTPFVDLVRRNGRFLLTTHVRPDGDGLGSMLALSDALERQGKETQLVIASPMPARYQFLDSEKKIKCLASPTEVMNGADAAMVLDTGTWNQLDRVGPLVRAFSGAKVVIDHHLTQDDLGAVQFVDTSAEATGRLVFEAITALGQPLSEQAASNLFVAVAMDTGWFRHSNARPATFALAAELVRQGARPEILYEHLFEQSTLPRLKLTGLVLDRLQLIGNNQVAYTEIRGEDYLRTGALPPDSEDLVNYTRSVAGVEVGLLFMEQPRGGVKVSFRSRSRVDVARVAERFGGGGHRLASGAVLDTDLADAKTRVLEAVLAALTPAG